MPHKRKPADDEAAAGNISALRDEIANLSKVLNSKLSLLEKVIEDVRDGQNGIVQSISFLNEKFEEMKNCNDKTGERQWPATAEQQPTSTPSRRPDPPSD